MAARAFKKMMLRLVGATPEVTQGTPNWDLTASGGTADTVTVAAASGAALYNTGSSELFDRLQIYFKSDTTTAALRGKVYTVSSYAWAANVSTFTTTANMAATPQNGDTFLVYALLKGTDVSVEPKVENLERDDVERDVLDPLPSVKGITSGSFSFGLEMSGLEQENGNGDTPRPDSLSQFLKGIGTRRAVAGTTCSAGWSTTTGDVADASNLQAYDVIMVGGVVTRITVKSGNTLTVSPPFSTAPSASDEVFVGERFTPDDYDHQSFTLLCLYQDQLVELKGCVFSLALSAGFGEKVMAQIEGDAEDWDMHDDYTWNANHSTKACIRATTGRSYFGTTQISVNSFDFNYNHGRAELRDDEITNRYFITSRKASCGVVFRNKNLTPKETWETNGTEGRLLIQRGNSAGDACAIVGNAQIQDPATFSEVEGHVYYDAAFGFIDDASYYEQPEKPELVRF